MCEHEDLVPDKLHADVPLFTKPSSTSFVCFVFFDTPPSRIAFFDGLEDAKAWLLPS